ncbi:hypothetical protein CYLTODRAFT_426341 [Cylindrobasidium torrendii FP15055 ss-10]|uniref:Uncharacterized protein n=1 Tax=Cylindrobasidium torrendii FP15055 ss-10 TaxID=1314674 RepID=A0A0D7AXQ4_9AGAR|nr:hypothetical protein CYLTODRAFT_426341 [Cylindrobasidium torrendii FP15055 ss-10]
MSRGRRDHSPPRLDPLPPRRPRSPFHNPNPAPEAPPARRVSRFSGPVSPATEYRPLAPTAPVLPPTSPVQVRRPSISSTSDSTPHNGTAMSPTAPYKRKRAALPPQGERFVTALEEKEKAAKDKAAREREERETQERQQREIKEREQKEREQKEREQKELESQQREQQERERREREAATAPSSPHQLVTDQAPVDGIPTGPRRTRRTGERDRLRDRPDDSPASAATSSAPKGPRAMQATGRRTPPPLAPAAMSRGRGPPEGPSSSRAPKMTGSNSTPVGPRRAASSITPQDEASRSPAILDAETVPVRNDRRPRPASPDRRYRPAQADRSYRPEFEPRPAYRNGYRPMNDHDRSYRPEGRSYQSTPDYKPAPEADHGYKKVSPDSSYEKATLPPASPVVQPKGKDVQMALDDEPVQIPPPAISVKSERQPMAITVDEGPEVPAPGTRSLLDRVGGKRVRDDDASSYGGPSGSLGYDAGNKRRRRGGKPRPERGPRDVSGSNSIPVVQRAL